MTSALPLNCFEPNKNLYPANSGGKSVSDLDILFYYYETKLRLGYI